MKIVLANPRGFCAGVYRAISIVENALEIYGAPIFVYHEIVHNRYIINRLRNQGVIFVEQIEELPDGAVLIFSAHGVSKLLISKAKKKNLTIFDATCPLVTRIHMKVARASLNKEELILIGHYGHPEILGTIGHYNNQEGGIYLVESPEDVWKIKVKREDNLSFVTQTTLSVDKTSIIVNELRNRFPKIVRSSKNDICYATTNRQKAVIKLSNQVDIVLVIGSKNSSNSNRLVELVRKTGKPAFLIDYAEDIQEEWIETVNYVGITAGASAPEILVKNVVTRLKELGGNKIISLGTEEKEKNISFKLPKEVDFSFLKEC